MVDALDATGEVRVLDSFGDPADVATEHDRLLLTAPPFGWRVDRLDVGRQATGAAFWFASLTEVDNTLDHK